MPLTNKKKVRKSVKKRKSEIVVIISHEISPEETLFPEKVARAKEMLRRLEVDDPEFYAKLTKRD